MTPVNPNYISTTDQATRTGGVDGADARVSVASTELPRRTLTLKTNATQRQNNVAALPRGATASGRGVTGPAVAPTPLKRLTAGRKELAIAHAGATYVLRVTKANRLILTKDSEEAWS